MGNCKSKKYNSNGTKTSNCNGNSKNANTNLEEEQIKSKRFPKQENIPIPISNEIGIAEQQEAISINEHVIISTKAELGVLLKKVHEFEGTTDEDKNYRYLDEMFTRCILELDKIECNSSSNRISRKKTISGINEAISILERKLKINAEIEELKSDLSRT